MNLRFWQSHKQDRLQKVKELAAMDDIQAVGYLAEATGWNKQTRAVAENALIRLLPRLQPEHSSLLNSAQRTCLYRYLSPKTPNTELTLAVLKALESIGDAEVLPFIERLATAESLLSPLRRQLIEAARECLPHLRRRREQTHLSNILMRPADPPCIPANAARQGPEE